MAFCQAPLAFGLPHGGEWIPILIIALLVFGRRLPEVSRSLGKAITEFKKGMREGEDGIDPDPHPPAGQQQPRQAPQQVAAAPAPGAVGGVEVRTLPAPSIPETAASATPMAPVSGEQADPKRN